MKKTKKGGKMPKEKVYLCSSCAQENDSPYSLDYSTKWIEVEPKECEACEFNEEMELFDC